MLSEATRDISGGRPPALCRTAAPEKSRAKHLDASQAGKAEILRIAQDDKEGRRFCHGPMAASGDIDVEDRSNTLDRGSSRPAAPPTPGKGHIMTIEQRLGRLERQNRQLKWLLSGLVGMAVTGCAMGLKATGDGSTSAPLAEPEVLRAERFEVIDAEGNPLAVIGPNGNGGVVFVYNNRGRLVAQMGAAEEGRGVVWTYDRYGYFRHDLR
jgi:hypothetical protein